MLRAAYVSAAVERVRPFRKEPAPPKRKLKNNRSIKIKYYEPKRECVSDNRNYPK
jgi:hypothetical protein